VGGITLKKSVTKVTSYVLLFALALSIIASGVASKAVHAIGVSISGSGGWNETAYVEWSPVSNAQGYNVYVKPASAADSQYVQIDTQLIRQYPSKWRADAVGLAAGNYVMKVEAVLSGGSKESTVTSAITVKAHDRSGFAFANQSTFGTGSGAYNEDGTLQNGAQVIYVTSATAQTVTLDVITSSSGTKQTGVGLGAILALRQKGYDQTPLAIRFIGKVTDANMGSSINSSGFLQVKGASAYTRMNTTIEGIGNDATVYGWGFLLRNAGNVEVRNLGILLFQDDAVSMDTGNVNIWVHNNDITYGKAGGDADQAKGDGSTDLKGASTYTTISYNHYWDSGKAALIGLSESSEFFVTFHHNWFDHSDSRHPRIRKGTIHVYNNFFDGVSKYGTGITTAGSAFVESNYYRHSKNPMLISLQGTDIAGGSVGTFSGENGGMIKAYNNSDVDLVGGLIYANSNAGSAPANATSFDAYLASTRNETVPSSYKALVGGTTYNNFDTTIDTGVNAADIDSVSTVEQVVTAEAGRLGNGDFTWTFNDAVDDTSSDLNSALMSKILSYTSQLVSVGGNSTPPTGTPAPTATPTTTPAPTATPTTTPAPTATPGTSLVHNFTTDGKTSSFFTIVGNLSTSKGTVVYNGLTLTQCLKMESSTNIGFTTTTAKTLTLVFNPANGLKVKIDGTSYAMTNGIVSVSLAPGAHTIIKEDVTNLYYMKLE
jgi:pectate lyase